jgi:hypothetical protein
VKPAELADAHPPDVVRRLAGGAMLPGRPGRPTGDVPLAHLALHQIRDVATLLGPLDEEARDRVARLLITAAIRSTSETHAPALSGVLDVRELRLLPRGKLSFDTGGRGASAKDEAMAGAKPPGEVSTNLDFFPPARTMTPGRSR